MLATPHPGSLRSNRYTWSALIVTVLSLTQSDGNTSSTAFPLVQTACGAGVAANFALPPAWLFVALQSWQVYPLNIAKAAPLNRPLVRDEACLL